MPRLAFLLLALALPSPAGAVAPPHQPGAGPSDSIVRTPSKNHVTFTLNGKTVWRYYITPDGRIYPGKFEDGEITVWDKAEPLLVSEYAYGGPISRLRIIRTAELPFYRTEATPKGLTRITTPKPR